MNPFLPSFIVLLIATAAVLVALFWRGKEAPAGSVEVMCLLPEPQGSAD